MPSRGLVIGKFYPPHRGHKYLIDTAAAQVDHLDVIVCDRPGQDPPASLRAKWLRETHQYANVIIVPDTVPDDDSRGWAEYTIQCLGYAPDVVFTSEDYGDPYARYMGCEHRQIDKARRVVPCSGTAIRANPLAYWDYLEPCVRAHYAVRICVVGAESTGTTTMAQALAEHYNTLWVPEYGRDYSVEKLARNDWTWHSTEFAHIAWEQCRMEDEAARHANRLLICDTDAFATAIWHRRYMDAPSPKVEEIAAPRRYALYLLTDVDIPFVQDGLRDGENIRGWMHGVFEEELRARGKTYAVLSGSHEDRMKRATELIDPFLRATTKVAT